MPTPGPAAVLLCAGAQEASSLEQSGWEEEVFLLLRSVKGARQALCGAQSNSHELHSFRMTSGAAESCLSQVPQGKTPAEAERPRNLWTCTVPQEKLSPTTTINFRPCAATPESAPLQNVCACLRVEEPLSKPVDPRLPILSQERQNKEQGVLDDIHFTFVVGPSKRRKVCSTSKWQITH